MKTLLCSCEILENRIAPAVFFLGHTTFDVFDKNGASVNDATAAGAVGADLAVFLAKGDSVVLDANGNHVLDAGETVFMKVAGGRAVLFAKGHDMNSAVDPDELTGLIVSDKFNGSINGNLNGSIVTGLGVGKTFDPTKLLDASISGLTVTGMVSGDILAGKNLTKITLGTAYAGDPHFDVHGLRAGSAADGQTVSFNGGATTFVPALGPGAEGAAGGSISHVKLALGAKVIAAGDGRAHPSGRGGAGGSISDVNIAHFSELGTVGTMSDMQIIAGNGGGGAGTKGSGGAGGSVRGLKLASSYSGLGGITMMAGNGGGGHVAGAGGALVGLRFDYSSASHLAVIGYAGDGGEGQTIASMLVSERVVDLGSNNRAGVGGVISGVTVNAASTHGRAEFWAGDGGMVQGSGDGRGGAGGNLSNFTLTSLGGDEAPYLRGGSGRASIGKAAGGAGGSISGVKIKTGNIIGNSNGGLYIYGGDSGWSDAGPGGAAGSIKNMNITMGSLGQGEIYIYGGDGGRAGGRGGNGGSVNNVVLKTGALPNSCYIGAGDGGNGNYYSGDPKGKVGGLGGALQKVTVDLDNIAGDTEFSGGHGGAGNAGALGGKGGMVKNLTVNLRGTIPNDLDVFGGRGGAGTNGGSGGAGGDVRSVTINKLGGAPDDIVVNAGSGGNGNGAGSGGHAGDVSGFTFTAMVPAHRLQIGAGGNGVGGEAGATGLLGGDGASFTGITVRAPAAIFTEGVFLDAGPGGAGASGGDGGGIRTVTLDAPGSLVRINADPLNSTGRGGDSGMGVKDVAGDGGDVVGITGKLGTLIVQAQAAGSGGTKGGAGGDISGITLKQVTGVVRELRAGDGGKGTTPGRGGSISGVNVPGDIGDFTVAFESDPLATTGMGGLFAGQSPTPSLNGSVTNITAARIAAILAGTPAANELNPENAVTKIAKLKTTAIGSDLDPGGFDFTDHDGDSQFELGDGDTALDGLVIVRAGGGTFPVTPLKVMEVP